MAVKVSEFFGKYYNNSVAFFMLIQILVVVLAGATGWIALTQFSLTTIEGFILALAILLLFEIIAGIFMAKHASQPLRILSQAIAHVSDDPVQTPPPNINNIHYERSGLKAVVQAVYQLAVHADSVKAVKPNDSSTVAQLSAVFANAPCGIIGINDRGRIILANPLAPIITNPAGEMELELLFEQSNGLDQWLADCRANKVRDTKSWRRIADKVPGEDGRHVYDVIAFYAKNSQQSMETILITVDRTGDYLPEDEDMDFIALAAHELRGPITVIRGYLDIMDDELKTTLTADQQMLIDRLQVSAEQLSGYINNILNVSRYDRNHLSLHLHEEAFIDIVKNLVPDLALRAKTKKRRLTFHIPSDLPTIAADRSSLSEVLSNLIDNAIKYSYDDGEVVTSAVVNGNFVEITVQDFGIGMPGSVMGELFTKFYRSHRSRQQVTGTGLGLYICRAIVESHGGSIWVRSIEGQGSTFGFTMPIYSAVADKLTKDDNGNGQIIERADGWIKNHAMYRK